jgi:hypothetical protein
MKRLFASISSFVLVGGASLFAQDNLLLNGNMDRSHAAEVVPGFFLPRPNSWIDVGTRSITGPYTDTLSSEPWAGPAPTPVTTDGNLNGPSPDGYGGPDGGVFFRPFTGNATDGLATVHLYQDLTANVGVSYTLTGWAGAEANALGNFSFAIDFLDISNSRIGGFELNLNANGLFTPNGEPFNYKQFSVSAIAPAGATTVRSRITMADAFANPSGGGQAFVVDDFVLVPEPSALILGLMGFVGVLAFRGRKARRQAC